MTTTDGGGPGTTVVPYENGPLLIRGDFALMTPDGQVIDPGRKTVALCRCGKSAVKPFCDGTHKAINFRAGTGRDPAAGAPTAAGAQPAGGAPTAAGAPTAV